MPDLLSPTTCRHLITALYYQRPLVSKEAEEKLAASNNFITRKIPDRGVTTQHANDDDVQFRTAHQPFAKYRTISEGPGDKISGTMPARGCDGTRTALTTLVDPFDANACHGTRTWNFAHGYALKTTQDFEDAVMTDVICIENYAQHGPSRVKAMFNALRTSFAQHGVDNFEANLRQKVIELGESNLSVTGSATHFNPTVNGWEAPPDRMLDIPFLERARQYWLGLEKSTVRSERDVMEIEVDRRSWFAAVADDILRTNGPQVSLEAKFYEDPRAAFYGRQFHEYKNIRAVFNDEPMKGYFRDNGAGWDFVEVLPHINVPGADLPGATEGAGLVSMRNPDYWSNRTVCNGVTYDLVVVGWLLSPNAFERWRLAPSIAPEGVNPLGTNFEVDVLKDAFIPCNEKRNKFRLIMQHKYRLKVKEPQLAGAIVYLPEPLNIGYTRTPCNDTTEDTAVAEPATYNTLEIPGPDLCEQATCETCEPGTVANNLGVCVADGDGVFSMLPCGTAEIVVLDETVNLVIKVFRTGNLKDAATVDYAVAAVTAVAGTNFTDPADATLSWAADEGGYKTITVPVLLADETDPLTFTVTLSNATGGASVGDCTVLTATILPTG
jgi:hypothetical protein